jgi:acyl-CoA thioester hydrolase
MGVVHHSNYVRWFEEARVDFLDKIGMGYDKIEAEGIHSPVLSVVCRYRQPVRFNEKVIIIPRLKFFNGIKMTISYRILDADTGMLRSEGETQHCFINRDFKMVSLKKDYKHIYELFKAWTDYVIDES